jgi:N-acyl homoserine lactone hydrolase
VELRRLHLASLQGLDGRRWPVHGFVVTHDDDAVLIDTGVGGPQDALDLSPADIGLVINTHLHFDHCGQNAVFRHAPFYVQRAELDRARIESPELHDWFDFAGARFELLDGDAEILPGLEVISTPGHTSGHQCVLIRSQAGPFDLLIGDAAYTPRVYSDPGSDRLPPGQASDLPAWQDSLRRIQSLDPDRVHFCHHTDVIHR